MKKARGFTLIEVLIAVAIVGLLSSVALPFAEISQKRDREQQLRRALYEIRDAIDSYRRGVDEGRIERVLGKSGYPPSLRVLVDGVPDQQSPDQKGMIYFLRRIPRDPTFPDPTAPPEDTWGKRSYESSAEDPQEGEDVFDVYSLSKDVGLNGIPYRAW